MTLLERAQNSAVAIAVVGGLLGLMTAGGCSVVPDGREGLSGLVHIFLFLLSSVAGAFSAFRIREVERLRWAAAKDPLATKGERKYAHREAESQRRAAGTAFLLAPLGVAYWLAYVFETDGRLTLSDLFLVTPVVGFLLAFLITARRYAPPPQEDLDLDDGP